MNIVLTNIPNPALQVHNLKRRCFYRTIFPCSQTSVKMKFLFVFFFVSLTTCNPNVAISPELLVSVFGNPDKGTSDPPKIALGQVVPVLPDQSTIENNDDGVNQFLQSTVDYDKFDWTLTKRVAAGSQENLLISPLGLKLALAILMEAATGATKAEISSVLGFESDKNATRRKFASILDSLHTKSSQYILNLGSRIYVGGHIVPQQRFAAISEQFYKTEIKSMDFNDPIKASNSINEWVANNTLGRITNLVVPDDVSGVSGLVLNTIFFKGTWYNQFPVNGTKIDSFYVTPTLKKDIPFMNVKNKFYYTESVRYNAKILRMPYAGNKFAMYIILPNSLTGLSSIFNQLSDLRSELNYLQEYLVDVTLPKFQFEYTSLLDGVLKELGIRQAFEDTASFPGISRGRYLNARLKISKVLQRSGIEVNELGSVAYSATEVVLENKFGGDYMSNAEIIANKPFLFFIQDDLTKQLLFTGRVADPSLHDGAFKFI